MDNLQILAQKSPYFKALFYADFKEKSQDVVKIGDVDDAIFKTLLDVIYLARADLITGDLIDFCTI